MYGGRGDGARHRHLDGRRRPARPCLLAAQPGRPCPRRDAGTARPAQPTDVDYPGGRAQPGAARLRRAALHRCRNCCVLLCVYLPLALGGRASSSPHPAAGRAAERPNRLSPARRSTSMPWLASLVRLLRWPARRPRGRDDACRGCSNRLIKPDKVYRLYGFHYWLHRADRAADQHQVLQLLFGDSSAIVHYLRWLGLRPAPGRADRVELRHRSQAREPVPEPRSAAGRWSPTGCRSSTPTSPARRSACRPASIGARNFLGNNIAYPAQGRTGDNCLLATKVMVPIDGQVREGVGLLGSPSFEIPRTVTRDSRFDDLETGDELRRGLSAKNRHNLVTVGLYLLMRWCPLLCRRADRHGRRRPLPASRCARDRRWPAWSSCCSPSSTSCWSNGPSPRCRPLTPLDCSIYDPRLLAPRAVLEGAVRPVHAALQRHPVQDLSSGGCWACGSAAQVFDDGCVTDRASAGHHRRRLHPQRRNRHPVPLPGGRCVQVRPHRDRRRCHPRGRLLSSTTARRWATAPCSRPTPSS